MTLSRFAVVAAALFFASFGAVDQAHAQSADQQMRDQAANRDRDRNAQEASPGTRRTRDRRGRQPSAQDITRSAQAVATTAGLSCQVSESSLLGTTNENDDLYEVACEGGAGYILTSASPPQTFDCLVLAAQADRIRSEGGEVAANSVCALPGNQNSSAVIAAFALEAGVACEVDAGKAIGATPAGNLVYEVGCAGSDGYHIEKTAEGWNKTDCLQIMATNLTCQFTTLAEQVAGFKPLLIGTAIDDCDPAQIHLLAQSEAGRYIEVKCLSGEGYVARVKDEAVEQVYPCARAVRIGGGCTLTPVEASAPDQ